MRANENKNKKSEEVSFLKCISSDYEGKGGCYRTARFIGYSVVMLYVAAGWLGKITTLANSAASVISISPYIPPDVLDDPTPANGTEQCVVPLLTNLILMGTAVGFEPFSHLVELGIIICCGCLTWNGEEIRKSKEDSRVVCFTVRVATTLCFLSVSLLQYLAGVTCVALGYSSLFSPSNSTPLIPPISPEICNNTSPGWGSLSAENYLLTSFLVGAFTLEPIAWVVEFAIMGFSCVHQYYNCKETCTGKENPEEETLLRVEVS